MASGSQKEPSALARQSPDELFHSTKLNDSEHSTASNDLAGSRETLPLADVTAASMTNNNRTRGTPVQIEASENEGRVRKGKILRSHRQHKKRFTCAVCGKSSCTKQALQSHLKWPTSQSGKSFALSWHLSRHKWIHTREKPFACRICGKAFARKDLLRLHELIHSGEKHFACRICGISKRASPVNRICGKSFVQRSHLSGHKLTHTGEKPFACRICGKSFAKSGTLSSHELTHTGEKPFACRICGKAFARRGTLGSHKLTHTAEKRFHCSVCGDGFRSKVGFQRHTEKHSEQKKSVCALCDEPFRLEEDLEKHLKWHIEKLQQRPTATSSPPRSCPCATKTMAVPLLVVGPPPASLRLGLPPPVLWGWPLARSVMGVPLPMVFLGLMLLSLSDRITIHWDTECGEGQSLTPHSFRSQWIHVRSDEGGSVSPPRCVSPTPIFSVQWQGLMEKRFHCSVCGDGFRSKVGFQRHTEKHSEEKKCVCTLCGEPFQLEEDLQKHLKWHIESVGSCAGNGVFNYELFEYLIPSLTIHRGRECGEGQSLTPHSFLSQWIHVRSDEGGSVSPPRCVSPTPIFSVQWQGLSSLSLAQGQGTVSSRARGSSGGSRGALSTRGSPRSSSRRLRATHSASPAFPTTPRLPSSLTKARRDIPVQERSGLTL
ncbi:unnamed protein product [Cyprideis torosa]|uniref:Uncharacterized protein n=1 Tax=Cyprideis torosa TaxID=163714 RepID=A0A7R8WDY6_9CRUS|nr:unnamed protein product [Cyprideis torosa]CAG0895158.1 unnamed protein product [Cyprideis torosa]